MMQIYENKLYRVLVLRNLIFISDATLNRTSNMHIVKNSQSHFCNQLS